LAPSHTKIKSVAKCILPKGDKLSSKILETMKVIADTVGSTLGPGGCPVLIERQEFGFPNLVTKDGVTVFRSLGFSDPIAHAIMESYRDAATRTAAEAGDGTTTATVLSEAIGRYTQTYCQANPKVSPQRVVRLLERIFKDELEPEILKLAITPDTKTLHSVAKCSANGDQDLADAIMKCFELAGDDGNITILEESGPSSYKVDLLKGYPLGIGYEDSVGRFFPAFLNDRQNARVYLDRPLFILNFGSLTQLQQLFPILEPLGEAVEKYRVIEQDPNNVVPLPAEKPPANIVIVATDFSETLVGQLASNFSAPNSSLKVLPIKVPRSAMQSGQMDIIYDLAALTGGKVFDPIRNPLTAAKPEELGQPLEYLEMSRYRSNVVGMSDESYLMARVDEVRGTIDSHGYESELELSILKERLGKLTGGIAKLTVVGASNGEIREKKDRADDAACAVRGAVKHGCLPGGCWTFAKLVDKLNDGVYDALTLDVVKQVLIPSLKEPFKKLLSNCGYNESEIKEIELTLTRRLDDGVIFDALNANWVSGAESGVMDSVPAVLEALRSSASIATQIGTLGAIVVFPRDTELERQEAKDTMQWLRDANAGKLE
jgi:chaperonin GroEL